MRQGGANPRVGLFVRQMGMTLVELLVVLAISSSMMLAIATLLASTYRINYQARIQADLTRDMQLFIYSLEQYLSQTTHVVTCNCASAAPTCYNDALANAAATGAGATTVLRFIFENAMDPNTAPTGGCLLNGSATIAGTTIVPRGCKVYADLVYTPPTNVGGGGTPSLPGSLVLRRLAPNGTVELARLGNVTSFGCGMTSFTPSAIMGGTTGVLNSDFRMRIDVKARTRLDAAVGSAGYESWAPGGQNFNSGIRRSHIEQIVFRNLTMTGVHFGKVRTFKECMPDGAAYGGDPMHCCSGYTDGAGNCGPATACTGNGAPAATANTAPGNDRRACCSQMITPGGTNKCI